MAGFLKLPRAFWVLFTGMFVNRVGSFVVPFLPLYLTSERGLSAPQAGMIVSVFGAGGLLAAHVGGSLSDVWGRRKTLLFGTLLGAVTMILLGLARTPMQIAIAAFLLGLNDIYRPASMAAIADIVGPEDRVRAFGYAYWAINLGFAFASFLAGVLAHAGYFTLFLGDAITTLAFFCIAFLFVKETRPARAIDQKDDPWLPWRDKRFLGFALAQLVVTLMFFQSLTTLALDMGSHGLGPEIFGRTIAWNGVAIVALQPFVLARTARVNKAYMLAFAALLVAAGFGLQAFAQSEVQYVVAVLMWTLGEICFSGAGPALVAELAPPHARGVYQGAFGVLWGIAAVVSPTLGNTVFAAYGGRTLWLASAAFCVLGAAMHFARGRRG